MMNLQRQIAVSKSELTASVLIFILVVTAIMSSRLIRLTSSTALVFDEPTEILVEEPTRVSQLFSVLDKRGVEYDREEMQWAARLLGWRNLQRGRYLFEGSYSYNNLLSKMARGIQDPVSVVVLPGITPERLANIMEGKLDFRADDILSVFEDSSYLAGKGFTKEQLFGRMLPETYLMYWNSSPETVTNKILREFDRAFDQELRNRAEELELSVNEVLTLASIIEWEAKNTEEKPTISGLYWNRLNRGMLLQADPTVNFAIGERRRLLYEDYQVDHPFNTYQNKGLPPGPVTNPSLSSIRAALNPEDHDYLYMVANPEGGHIFSRTYQQHLVESEKWRRWLREQYRIKRQREAEQEQEPDKETR